MSITFEFPVPKPVHPKLRGKAALVIEWEKLSAKQRKKISLERYEWIAHYYLLLPLDYYDIRNETEKGIGTGGNHLKLLISQTKSSGGAGTQFEHGRVNTPFRDGSHIMWDQKHLQLPMYAVYKQHLTRLQQIAKP